jgi:serine/threonine-protein kinase
VDLLNTLCLALGYAHERKLLHRDLKPTNILVAKGGKLRLAGFGLGALRVRELGRADGYPSPEFLGGAPFDVRSDLYALGGVIFHALTGFHPESEQVSKNGSPPRLRQIVPDAPDSLETLLARCLARDPAERFSSTAEVLAEVRGIVA